ncbi:MAG: hypothetical protein JW917_06630 [Ignavibacteria bacterium]|nr:hypothetical protein [Ignavibacteria bacterium]
MKRILVLLFSATVIAGCDRMEEKKTTGNQENQNTKQIPSDTKGNMNSTAGTDSVALKLSQDAYEFEKVYEKNKTAADKQELIRKHLSAGNAFSPDGNVHHMNRESFRTSLKHYRRVLELDPLNNAAKEGKELIEGMYKQIGLPVPE